MELSPKQVEGIYKLACHGVIDEDCIIRINEQALLNLGVTALQLSREFEGIAVELP